MMPIASISPRFADYRGHVDELVSAALGAADADGGRPMLTGFLRRLDELLVGTAEALDTEHFSHQMPQRTVFTPNNPRVR